MAAAPCSPPPVEAMRRYMASLPPPAAGAREELRQGALWRCVRREFLSTLLLTVLGCGACLRHKAPPADGATAQAVELRVALAFGLAAATLSRGGLGPCLMNPAVTVAMLVTRHVSALRGAACVAAQCAGATAGAAILYGLAPADQRHHAGLGATDPAAGVAPSEAFGIEFLASVVVVITVLSVHSEEEKGCGAISIGLSYVAGHLLAFPYTGASFNPARSFGPAIVTNTWRLHWIYWVAPMLGGIIGGVTFDYTQESHSQSTPQRSLPMNGRLHRDISALSGNETELTLDHGRL